jgi:hypothetical protein
MTTVGDLKSVERFSRDLDTLLSDIAFSGLKNVHPGVLEKLARFEAAAGALGMEQGAALISRFASALRAYRLAEHSGTSRFQASPDTHDTRPESGRELSALLAGLDFYNRNISGNLDGAEAAPDAIGKTVEEP